jgi:hypothetical protein
MSPYRRKLSRNYQSLHVRCDSIKYVWKPLTAVVISFFRLPSCNTGLLDSSDQTLHAVPTLSFAELCWFLFNWYYFKGHFCREFELAFSCIFPVLRQILINLIQLRHWCLRVVLSACVQKSVTVTLSAPILAHWVTGGIAPLFLNPRH